MARLERQRVNRPPGEKPDPGTEESTTEQEPQRAGQVLEFRRRAEVQQEEVPTEKIRKENDPEGPTEQVEEILHEELVEEQGEASELERLREQLRAERLRIVEALQNNYSWYERLRGSYQQQKEWLAHIDSALAQVSQLEGKGDVAEDVAALRVAVEKKVGFSNPEERKDPMLVGWEDFDQFVEVQERGEPQMRADVFGTAKQRTEKDMKKVGALGEYGQDGSVINESTGTAVAFDGSTSGGPESYRVTHLIAKKVEEILSGLPEAEDDVERINAYIQGRFQEVQDMLEWLPQDVRGAGMFVATRLLKDSNMLVSVRLGDGHMTIKQGDATAEPLMAQERELFIENKGKMRNPLGIGVKNTAIATVDGTMQNGRTVFMRDPVISVQKVDLSRGPLRIALCSDGLDALVTGRSGGKETPQTVLDRGGVEYLRQEGVVQHPVDASKDDDLAYIMVEYPASEPE